MSQSANRMTRRIVAEGRLKKSPIAVIDVGARGGFEEHWDEFGDQALLTGFEPDEKECERMNRELAGGNRRFFPYALHKEKITTKFHLTRFPDSCGLYEPNTRFASRLLAGENLDLLSTTKIDAVDLDSVAAKHDIGATDFIKLDLEGGELDVLKGAVAQLEKSVWGLSIEVAFCELHKDRPQFGDVEAFLRKFGFVLFDLELNRHGRKVFPQAREWNYSPTPVGQIIWGQAIFLRDAVDEIRHPSPASLKSGWDETRLIKLACVMEIFNLRDCAVELILEAKRAAKLSAETATALLNDLVPELDRKQRVAIGMSPLSSERPGFEEYCDLMDAAISFRDSEAKPVKPSIIKRLLKPIVPSFLRRYLRERAKKLLIG